MNNHEPLTDGLGTREGGVLLLQQSSLRGYHWSGRGRAKPAYLLGMVRAFAVAVEMLHRAEQPGSHLIVPELTAGAWLAGRESVMLAARPAVPSTSDILSWYRQELVAAGAATDTESTRLAAIFSLMIGLGMRESCGRHCVCADTPGSRAELATEKNAEAGLFQVSYDSVAESQHGGQLFVAFRGRTDLLSIFSKGVICRAADHANVGSGDAAAFQETMKRCPLFAVLYTAAFLREDCRHWGPIKNRKVEVPSAAAELFTRLLNLLSPKRNMAYVDLPLSGSW